MGEVFRGRDHALEREVAVKVLPSSFVGDEASERRFRREARTAAGLVHPNVVAVHDAIVTGPVHAIVMELVDGPTLAELLQREGPLAPERAMALVRGIALGLGAAHDQGLVHRDVKPSNVVVTPDGVPKITDFGIARVTDASLTGTGAVTGSVPYVAPEQARGDEVDPRTDLYALGCVLFELLTGRPPFVGDDAVGVLYQHLHEDPPDLRTLVPNVPAGLAVLTTRLLSKEPAGRPASATAVVRELDRLRDGTAVVTDEAPTRPIGVAGAPPPAAASAVSAGGTEASAEATTAAPSLRRSGRDWLPAGLAVAVLLLALLAASALRDDTDAPEVTATSLPTASAPAADPGSPGSTPTPTPSASATPPPEPTPTSTPTDPQPAGLDDAVAGYHRTLDELRESGELSPDGYEDLADRMEKVMSTYRKADGDDDDDDDGDRRKARQRLEELRRRASELVADGELARTSEDAVLRAVDEVAAHL